MKTGLIPGETYTDKRGAIHSVNDFDMSPVVRMYKIQPAEGVIRAWQGHRKEQKWFYAVAGSFEVKIAAVADWTTIDIVKTQTFQLNSDKPGVLHIPPSYINGFRALSPNSSLLVFSDFTLSESKADDIRFSLDQLAWNTF